MKSTLNVTRSLPFRRLAKLELSFVVLFSEVRLSPPRLPLDLMKTLFAVRALDEILFHRVFLSRVVTLWLRLTLWLILVRTPAQSRKG